MKVFRPTNNPLTRGYSASHRAYDFAGRDLPDEVKAALDGLVVETVNLYNTNWINNGTLTTKDYGNYIIVRHDDGSRELHAHLRKDSMLPINTRVKQGQIIARIGNTGNSTGPHLHSEFRDSSNTNIEVEFITNLPPQNTMPPELSKYRLDWKEVAVSKGLDVNSSQFANYREIDKIISDRVNEVSNAKNIEIRRLEEANGKLAQQLAECKLSASNDEFTQLGRNFSTLVKKGISL